jgi:hypothetical protein
MSVEAHYPVLCGGTFFALLLQAAKPGLYERKKILGQNEEITEADIFEALIQVVAPTYRKPIDKDNFRPIVSAYKSCNTRNGGSLPIYRQIDISRFDDRIRNEYQSPYSVARDFIEQFIDVQGRGTWLAKALLDMIRLDQSIPDSNVFYVGANGKAVSKASLIAVSAVDLSALLLGVWHYIVMHKSDNSAGKLTYDTWCKPGKSRNTREPFQSDIGSGIMQDIQLGSFQYEDSCGHDDYVEPESAYESYEEADHFYGQADEDYKNSTNSFVNYGLLIQQFGGNNKVFGSIGTLIINND